MKCHNETVAAQTGRGHGQEEEGVSARSRIYLGVAQLWRATALTMARRMLVRVQPSRLDID